MTFEIIHNVDAPQQGGRIILFAIDGETFRASTVDAAHNGFGDYPTTAIIARWAGYPTVYFDGRTDTEACVEEFRAIHAARR